MKIKIIKNGGYLFGGSLKLPVTIEAIQVRKYQYGVEGSGLVELGASPKYINDGQLYLFNERDVEVISSTDRILLSTGDKDIFDTRSGGRRICKAIRQGDQMQCVCGLAWDVDEEYTPQCQN